jgi:hypothetical protein
MAEEDMNQIWRGRKYCGRIEVPVFIAMTEFGQVCPEGDDVALVIK